MSSVVTTFPTRKQAEDVLKAWGGELNARWDVLTGEYRYERNGNTRTLKILRQGDSWDLVIGQSEQAL